MKKAKEYADFILENVCRGDDALIDAAAEVLVKIYKESLEMVRQRNVKQDTGLFPILDALDTKWVAIAGICKSKGVTLSPRAFSTYLEKRVPEVYYGWVRYKETLRFLMELRRKR